MLMHKRHPRLVHTGPIGRQSKLRQFRLGRERRRRVTSIFCQVLLLLLEVLLVVVVLVRRRDVRSMEA
jgi:hypothetical protein